MNVNHRIDATDIINRFYEDTFVPGDIVEAFEGRINHRYARELIGLLVEAQIVLEFQDGYSFDFFGVGDEGRGHAIAMLDSKAHGMVEFDSEGETPPAKTEEPAMTTTATTTATTAPCACKCGNAVRSSKVRFLPGHDARLVGNLARDVVTGDLAYTNAVLDLSLTPDYDTQYSIDEVSVQVANRFSERLAAKFVGAAHNAWAKANKATAPKGPAVPETDPEDQWVKVGRWTYPTRTWTTGKVERNTKRDGSGEWVTVPTA